MKNFLFIIGIIVLAIVILFLAAWPLMLLWNYVMPAVFVGVSAITYKQALALMFISAMLFNHSNYHSSNK